MFFGSSTQHHKLLHGRKARAYWARCGGGRRAIGLLSRKERFYWRRCAPSEVPRGVADVEAHDVVYPEVGIKGKYA